MKIDFFQIIFWLLLLDSLSAFIVVYFNKEDYFNRFKFFQRWMPLTKGWTLWYLILVFLIGYLVYF
jgi:hypothetical protein